ncbi:hypothetical protein FGIG_03592 [Fasciola gigantica]|uniref:Uncharacterized protein n=1 Tax=Fasciola gigantica TaxID=46835 RepID=A0A504YU71_FASGI|nr:hypothetical protein FGIG_03592 [Fasciola gigantica]
MAVRLVRKTKTNFLLSTTKKSRKPKVPVPYGGATAPPASVRHGSHYHEKVTSGKTDVDEKESRKREHTKSRENPEAEKSRKETSSKPKTRSSLRKKKSERSSKGTVISGSNKSLPSKSEFIPVSLSSSAPQPCSQCLVSGYQLPMNEVLVMMAFRYRRSFAIALIMLNNTASVQRGFTG